MVRQLHAGGFIDGADNVVLIGGPGTSKRPHRHRARRPGGRASPQEGPLLLHRRSGQCPRTGEGCEPGRPARRPPAAARSRHPRRTRLPAVQPVRRRAPLPSALQALRADQRGHHHQPQLLRMGRRLRRRQDDHGPARPADHHCHILETETTASASRPAPPRPKHERKNCLLDHPPTTRETPSTRVTSQWKSRVKSQRKSTI